MRDCVFWTHWKQSLVIPYFENAVLFSIVALPSMCFQSSPVALSPSWRLSVVTFYNTKQPLCMAKSRGTSHRLAHRAKKLYWLNKPPTSALSFERFEHLCLAFCGNDRTLCTQNVAWRYMYYWFSSVRNVANTGEIFLMRCCKHSTVLCGGEAWAPRNVYVNIKKNIHWSAENPVTVLEALRFVCGVL